VPDRVLRAIAQQTIDHRGPEFARLGAEVLAGMQRLFRTKAPACLRQLRMRFALSRPPTD